MDTNETMASKILAALQDVEIGKKLRMEFSGLPIPVEVVYTFAGGWVITQRLVPGMPLEIVRGEDGHLRELKITLLPHDGIREVN